MRSRQFVRPGAPEGFIALVLALVLLGAGSKAGIVPLHVWLPLAHPAAPSHVSALMSGVMTKVAIYGFIRIIFDLSGSPEWWEGMIVLTLGGITAVMGLLYALMERDLKRLLAYSSIENIGIIYIGLGLALAFQANHMPASGCARAHCRLVPCLQSFRCSRVFCSLEPVLCLPRPASATWSIWRAHPPHAEDRLCVSDRVRGHFGLTALQWLCLRVADLSGHSAESAIVRNGG
jgi:hypothetical protein